MSLCDTVGTAWKQPTWRDVPVIGRVLTPLRASLSFDGKTWVTADSLANEPQTGQPNRTPK